MIIFLRRDGEAKRRADDIAAGDERHEEEGDRPPHQGRGLQAQDGKCESTID